MRIATRSSALALAQAETVAEALGGAELVSVANVDGELGDKARFVRTVEGALRDGRGRPGRALGEGPAGRDARRARAGRRARARGPGRRLRRRGGVARRRCPRERGSAPPACAAARSCSPLRPDLEVVEIRGNVDTRLRKLADGELDGIVLAVAGLRRLGRDGRDRVPLRRRRDGPRARAGLAGASGSRRRRRDAATAAARISDHEALVEFTAERAATRRWRRRARRRSASAPATWTGPWRSPATPGCPTARSGCATRCAAIPSSPPRWAQALAERMLAAGAGEILERAGV